MTSFCISRSDDNRRAAGAVDLFSIQNSFYSNESFNGLTARRRGISVYSVCSVDSKILNFRVFRVFRGSNLIFWL